jgi:hypothetical protein
MIRNSATLLVCLATLVLAACAETPLAPTSSVGSGPIYQPGSGETFNEADFAWSRGPGSGGIDGQMDFHQGPLRYSCRGRDVILTPDTPWVRRRMYILYGSVDQAVVPLEIVRARTPAVSSGDYASYARKTVCDEDSRFGFRGLAPGGWYVITLARPVDANGAAVAIMRRVQVGAAIRSIDLY